MMRKSTLIGGQKNAQPNHNDLASVRDRILTITLRVGAAAGALALLAILPNTIQNQNWVLLTFYIIVYLWVVATAVFNKIPYVVRAGGFLTILLLLALSGLLEAGMSGDGRIFLMGFAMFATMLIGWRSGVFALVLSALIMAGMGIGFTQGYLPMPATELLLTTQNPLEWLSGGVNLVMIALFGLAESAMIINGLQHTLEEHKNLAKELNLERANLQNRVTEQTQDLERRLTQLRTAAEISRSVVTFLDAEVLLGQVARLIQDRFDLYYVGIFLLDEKGQYAVLRAGTGEAGEKMIAAGHRLVIGGSSMIGWTVEAGKARIALDVGQEAVRFNNPYLPLTRSEMALPLTAGEHVLGAISVQSTEAEAFDEDDILVLQSIADVVATSLQNANLLQSTQANLDEIRALHRQYLAGAWTDVARSHGQLGFTATSEDAGTSEKSAQVHIPLTLRDQVIGELTLDTREGELSPEDMVFVEAVITQTALALENARLLEESQRRASQEQTLNDMTTRFSRAIQVDDILKIALQELGRLPAVSEVSVFLEPSLTVEPLPGNADGDPLNS